MAFPVPPTAAQLAARAELEHGPFFTPRGLDSPHYGNGMPAQHGSDTCLSS